MESLPDNPLRYEQPRTFRSDAPLLDLPRRQTHQHFECWEQGQQIVELKKLIQQLAAEIAALQGQIAALSRRV